MLFTEFWNFGILRYLTCFPFIWFSQDLSIDISERPPQDCQGGIEYKVIGEACLPSICTLQQNVSSIFEEHRIVSNLNIFRYHAQELEPGSGVFGEEENKFVFYNVIVGHKVKARIKISNPNKVGSYLRRCFRSVSCQIQPKSLPSMLSFEDSTQMRLNYSQHFVALTTCFC